MADRLLLMKYIGTLTLLGRVAKRLPAGHQDQYGLDRAFRDGNATLAAAKSHVRFCRASGGGWDAFDVEQVEHLNPYTHRTPVLRKGK
jgi:hypothetical protein